MYAGSNIIVEEFLDGEEASFFALLDGHTCLALASAQVRSAASCIHDKPCQQSIKLIQPTNSLAAGGPPRKNTLLLNLPTRIRGIMATVLCCISPLHCTHMSG